jgi:hypothetical protein
VLFVAVMNANMFFASEGTFGRRGGPTATELSRIRHTKKMLTESEAVLTDKMARAQRGTDLATDGDIRQQALEIHWGWQQLRSFVDALPDSCIDKQVWLTECTEGVERSAYVCAATSEDLSARRVSVWNHDKVTE